MSAKFETMKYDLEDRIINFSANIIGLCKSLSNDYVSTYLGHQLIRSGNSPSLMYGEAQSAESRRDFIHKMKIALKELRESRINMKIIDRANLQVNKELLIKLIEESNQLISIFVKSVETARKNLKNE